MEISKQDLIKIVERASTITERLGSGFLPDKAQANERRINYLLKRWCQAVAQGNEEKFTKRLTWDGLDINTVRRGLGTVCLAAHQPLPTWVETLKLVMQAAAVSLELLEIGDSGAHRYLNPEEPIAFQEFCLPFIKVAQQKLIVKAGSSYSLLTEVAHARLERHLLWRLSYICSQTLKLEFSIFGAFKQSTFTHLLASSSSSSDKKRYQAFIKQMLEGGLLAFFQEYG
jgi:lantibiotic modifying enzyme